MNHYVGYKYSARDCSIEKTKFQISLTRENNEHQQSTAIHLNVAPSCFTKKRGENANFNFKKYPWIRKE